MVTIFKKQLLIFLLSIMIPINLFANFELSIVTIFKNESPFLKEWIEFHLLQGVEHFYLYNNNSSDDYLDVLKPYIKKNIVTLTDWPYTFNKGETANWLEIQCASYMDCIHNFGDTTKWLAAIDSDEFLFCPDGQQVPIFLKDFEQFGGVVVNWLIFGTSNVESIPPDTLMIEMLTCCAEEKNYRNKRIKSIVQPKHVLEKGSAHAFKYKEGYFAVTVNGKRSDTMLSSSSRIHDKLRINHYWTRTEKYFREKKIQSRHNRRTHQHESDLSERAEEYNRDTNTEILQFVPELRKKMGFKIRKKTL